jgi:hypothetical protein
MANILWRIVQVLRHLSLVDVLPVYFFSENSGYRGFDF